MAAFDEKPLPTASRLSLARKNLLKMFKKRHFVYARGFSKYFRKFPIARERERESERDRARIVAHSLFWRPDQALDDLAKLWYKRDVYTRISKVLHVANMNVYLIIYLFMFVACQYLDEWRKTAKKCRNAACNERFSFILQHILQQFTMFFYFSLSININYLNVPILYAWCCLFSFFPVKFGALLDFLD